MAASTRRLVDDLASHLRSRLVSGEYAANATLSESGVAAEYGVARPTARAAMDVLAMDGLLIREAHLPPRVPQILLNDLSELLGILEAVERMALHRLMASSLSITTSSFPDEGNLASLLNALTVASGSERLSVIHRRTTFEWLLGLKQNGVNSGPTHLASERTARQALVESIAQDEVALAVKSLNALQSARRLPIESELVGK